ncbi:acyl-CoA dehydrogenase family protein [Chelatococcus sp. GCM10030263]|uniref:acyl-CoA dehydrogenase family protein n=1 Tax=Chelatococcus sp. GCM10030263 TaxID=3273387 RepID=UPI0036199AB7
MTDDYEALLARARALVPVLRERAERTEDLRGLPPETEADLHEAGLFRILQPRRVGGAELDYVALVDFAAELARGDASVGWNLANLASHHWMLAMFGEEAQDIVWNESPDTLIASSFIFHAGRATKTEGGYRLSGRWPFSSGVEPSLWNMLAAVVTSEDEADASEYRIFLVHKRDYRIIDTWDSAGLRGTGSHDVEVGDIFVPEEMTLPVSALTGGATPGSSVNPGPLYRLPVFALFPFVLSGVGLGNAQGCLEDYEASARVRASTYNRAKLADLQSTQIKVAAAAARIAAARRIMRGICIEAMADAARGRVPDLLEKTAYRRDGAFSVNLCTEAVSLIFGASGAGGLYRRGTLQRQFRDGYAVNAHIAFNFDAAGSGYGRVALGLPSENPTL